MRLLAVFLLAGVAYCADLADLNFMTGHWTGETNGSTMEETWTGTEGASMMGMYREMKGGQTTFYELLVVELREGTPTLLLKHFDPGLKGWEEKDKAVTLPLQQFQPNEVTFVSDDAAHATKLTYRRTGKNTLEAVLERQRKGEWTKLVFRYTLAKK